MSRATSLVTLIATAFGWCKTPPCPGLSQTPSPLTNPSSHSTFSVTPLSSDLKHWPRRGLECVQTEPWLTQPLTSAPAMTQRVPRRADFTMLRRARWTRGHAFLPRCGPLRQSPAGLQRHDSSAIHDLGAFVAVRCRRPRLTRKSRPPRHAPRRRSRAATHAGVVSQPDTRAEPSP